MKTNYLLLPLFIFSSTLSFAQNHQWAKKIGSANIKEVLSIAVDDAGNVYMTGNFMGTMDFDPGTGITNLTAAVFKDAYILKLNASGNFVWARSLRANGSATGIAIAVDAAGNTYTTGHFENTVDFDPGSGIVNLISADFDGFVLKLDPAGDFVWVRQIRGKSNDFVSDIVVNFDGDSYTTGYYYDTLEFDPGGATTPKLSPVGGYDAFVCGYNTSGDLLMAKSYGGVSQDHPRSIALDEAENIYTIGDLNGTADFDPGPNTQMLNNNSGSIFISKLDPSGNYVWAKNFGRYAGSYGTSITVDDSGNVCATGNFMSSGDFDPGPATFNMTSTGNIDMFILKLDAAGVFTWAKRIGGNFQARGEGIITDNTGNIYVTGNFADPVDFDPGPSTHTLNSYSSYYHDIFLLKLNSAGNFIRAESAGGGRLDYGMHIALNAADSEIYIAGLFSDTVDFDPGSGTDILISSNPGADLFILKTGNIDPVAGVKDYAENRLSIFPNPATDRITVQNNENLNGTNYIITDMIGRAIITGKLNEGGTTIALDNLATGIYTFRVGENSLQSFKVMKY